MGFAQKSHMCLKPTHHQHQRLHQPSSESLLHWKVSDDDENDDGDDDDDNASDTS